MHRVYFALIRDSGTTYTIEFREDEIARLTADIKRIDETFTEIAKTAGCDRYLCLIELRLRRLDDILVLVGSSSTSERFNQTLVRIKDEGRPDVS